MRKGAMRAQHRRQLGSARDVAPDLSTLIHSQFTQMMLPAGPGQRVPEVLSFFPRVARLARRPPGVLAWAHEYVDHLNVLVAPHLVLDASRNHGEVPGIGYAAFVPMRGKLFA